MQKDNGVIQIAWASLPGKPVLDRSSEAILAFLTPTKRTSLRFQRKTTYLESFASLESFPYPKLDPKSLYSFMGHFLSDSTILARSLYFWIQIGIYLEAAKGKAKR